MYTGQVLFSGHGGTSNNDLLRSHMETMGRFPNRMVKRHVHNYTTLIGKECQFEAAPDFRFRQHDTDPVTGRAVLKRVACSAASFDFQFFGAEH